MIYFEHALFHRLSHSRQAIIGFDQISPSASSIRDLGLWDGLGSLGSISNNKKSYGLNRSQISLISKSDLNVNEA